MITHLRGSLSKNITDIVKGSGCPKIKTPIRNYSVLRYFSRQTNATYGAVSGVIGDGGHVYNGVSSGTSAVYSFNPETHDNPHFNLNLSYPDDAPNISNFHGQRNYLNIWNLSEVVGVAPTGTIQNIELANDIIERDGSNYYNYNLYKKSHTMDITPAGSSTPVSKTAELMEFVYLHSFIPRCRAGELYIEIEDFDLTGATTNDYLIYCYYWETTSDYTTIGTALENTNDYLSANANLLLTDQGNTCCKVFKLSDVKGTGTDNKLIIWLNRLKTKSEKFAVNVLIGLKPQELRRDEITYLVSPGYTTDQVIEYDECDDIIFKFKKATIKNKAFATSINNQPMAFPDFGYKNLYLNTFADDNHYIEIPIHGLDIDNNATAYTNPTTVFGPPNGGALVAVGDTWRFQENYIPLTSSYDNTLSPFIRYSDSVVSSFTVYNFFQTTQVLDPAQTYRLKLPMITNAGAYKISVNGGSYSVPPTFYYDIMAAHATDYVINIYVGDPLTFNPGSTYPRYRTFLDSLILLESFTVAQLTDGLITCNSGSDPEFGSAGTGVIPVIGSPYYGYDEIECKKNKYRFIEFLGSDVSPLTMPLYFYMSIERPSTPIKTISYAPVNVGGSYYPTGYNHPNTTSEQAQFRVIAEYVRPYWGGADNTLYKNYDCMLFKAPQIIAKTAQPSAENYYTA